MMGSSGWFAGWRGQFLPRYVAGDTLVGEVFTRASTGTFIDANGIVQTAATGVKRDAHYVGGVRTLLMEMQRTNVQLYSENLGHSSWAGNVIKTPGQSAPDGATTAYAITANVANAEVYRSAGAGAVGPKAGTFYVRRRTGTGVIRMIDPAASYGDIAVTSVWQRFTRIGGNFSGTLSGLQIATSGDAVDAWGAQVEVGAFATSYIPTTTAAVTRAVDAYTIPGVAAGGSPRLYQRYYDLATAVWVDSDTAYTSGADIVPAVNRALSGLGVFAQAMTTEEYRTALGI